MLKLEKMLATAAALAIALSLLSGCGSGAPGSSDSASGGLVRSVNIATQAVGTSYYTMGTGIAKIITDKTPIQATILPYAGPDAWMPEFNDGTITLEVISSMDMYWAYSGTVNYTPPSAQRELVQSLHHDGSGELRHHLHQGSGGQTRGL